MGALTNECGPVRTAGRYSPPNSHRAGSARSPDLTARQLGVFLTCYLDDEAQTVRGWAAKLKVSKPAITRALDRLSEFDLVRRKTGLLDRRSVSAQWTATGMAFLRDLKKILAHAGSEADKAPRARRPVPA